VAGEHLPVFPPSGWEALLRTALGGGIPFRVIRVEGARAIVEVDHLAADRARVAWNGPLPNGLGRLATVRTWGTLVGAKNWLRRPADRA
jgi:hypothetical protein